MRSIFFLFLLLCVSAASRAQINNNDWKSEELKGKVKSLTKESIYRYKESGVFTAWGKMPGSDYQYNLKGLTTEFKEINKEGTDAYKILYNYKPKEKKAAVTYYDSKGKPYRTKTFLYDDSGRRIEELEYRSKDTLYWRYTYTYDLRGNNTAMGSYKGDGTLYSTTTWTYDDKGNVTSKLLVTPGYANSSEKYVYDDKGNKIEEFWYDGRGITKLHFIRSYDEYGNLIKEVKYKGENKLLDTVTWRYEYDKKGNWIKQTQSTSDGEDFYIKERKIVYY